MGGIKEKYMPMAAENRQQRRAGVAVRDQVSSRTGEQVKEKKEL